MQEILGKVNKYLENSSSCYIEVDKHSKEELVKIFSLLEENNYKYTSLDDEEVIKVEGRI